MEKIREIDSSWMENGVLFSPIVSMQAEVSTFESRQKESDPNYTKLAAVCHT